MTMIWCPDSFLSAYRFSAEAHRGQTVPGTDGLPYILHVSIVAMEVCGALGVEGFRKPDLAVQCALLHDTIEDTSVTYEQLAQTFGTAVADGVLALTKNDALPKVERMPDSLRRIREQPHDVWIVKLADRIANLQNPPSRWSTDKRRRYRNEAITIRDALSDASAHLGARLDAKISAYVKFIES